MRVIRDDILVRRGVTKKVVSCSSAADGLFLVSPPWSRQQLLSPYVLLLLAILLRQHGPVKCLL
jgi:hypothetical protein